MGLGELNIGGGGIGPISETGIGGSGSSDKIKPVPGIEGGGRWCGSLSWAGGVLVGGIWKPSVTETKTTCALFKQHGCAIKKSCLVFSESSRIVLEMLSIP